MLKNITVSPSPHISGPYSTRKIMLDVLIALVPATIASIYYFRGYAVKLLIACIITALVTEWLCNKIRKKTNSLSDLSAVVTAMILVFSVPPTLPVWAGIIGTAFAIVIGKMIFGGLGSNIFNPAMVGRAFLTASFGMMMTTWTVPATINPAMPEIGPENQSTDVRTQATPLAQSKQAIKSEQGARLVDKQLSEMFYGNTGGCIGETSVLALLIGGIYMLVRKTIKIHIPLAVLLSAFACAAIGYLIDPAAYINPISHITAGGLMIGALFIATDPVTSPLTVKGKWIFGIGVGALVMLIRMVGEYPGAVMYSILLMNSVTPLIDRFCKRVPAGGEPAK